jgi:hypothetical protein
MTAVAGLLGRGLRPTFDSQVGAWKRGREYHRWRRAGTETIGLAGSALRQLVAVGGSCADLAIAELEPGSLFSTEGL